MKLLHLGDLHLGKALADFDLIEDQKYILDQILKIVKKQNVDTVLIAGDVYDKAIPSEAATNLLDYFLSSLAKMNVNTFMISGNHDSDDRLNYGSSLFETNKIYICAIYDGTLHKYTIEDENGEVDVYLLPFVKASQVRHFYPEEQIDTYEDAVKVVLANAEIDKSHRNIIVAHQFVSGDLADPVLGGSESVATQSVGTIEKISYEIFNDFDYVALGHIHSAQSIGREEVRYSGSPLKYSLSEANSDKSVPVVTLGAKDDVEIELVSLNPLRDLRHITGTIKDLLKKENISKPDDFIYVTLTDEDFVNDAMGIFQQYYPNTVKVSYDNKHTKEVENVDISQITEHQSFESLIKEFYEKMYKTEMSDEELALMKEVAKKAGVADETD